MGRPREHDEATRVRLLAAAEHVSGEDGWPALTVRRVAAEAGTSTRAVYSLFESKEGLEQALHQAMFTRLRELLRASPRSDDPRTDLLTLAQAYRRWATESPQRYTLAMHRFVGPGSAPRSEEGLEVARAALDELRQTVRRCAAAGLLGERPVEEVVTELRATVHGLSELENLGSLGSDPGRVWHSTLSALLDGYAGQSRLAA
jgi:AcrR family transcriptional regulator